MAGAKAGAKAGAATAAALELEAEGVAEAVLALRVLGDTLSHAPLAQSARGATLASGWKLLSRRQAVDILVDHSGALGPGVAAVMGVGELNAPVGVAYAAMEDDRARPKLDGQWISTAEVAALPLRDLQRELDLAARGDEPAEGDGSLEPGWQALEASVVDTLYRSPSWPVANRQTVCARVVALHRASGRLRVALRSVRSPVGDPPAGFVRGTVATAGYELRPAEGSGGSASVMVYANALDPNGSLPQSVVSMTVADRAMIVARLRRLLEAEPAAWADPFAPAGLPAGLASPAASA